MYRLASRFRLWIAVLLIAALTVVPALDALACADDGMHAAETGADAAKAPSQDDAGDHALGACGHNHCHHAGGNVWPVAGDLAGPGRDAGALGPEPPALPLSGAGDGLMRPPRV